MADPSFDPTLATVRDRLRLAIGDVVVTDATTVVFLDATYDALIAASGSEDAALLAVARAAYAKLANEPTQFKDGDAQIAWGNRVKGLEALIDRLTVAADIGGSFDIAEIVSDGFSSRDRLWNERLRSAS